MSCPTTSHVTSNQWYAEKIKKEINIHSCNFYNSLELYTWHIKRPTLTNFHDDCKYYAFSSLQSLSRVQLFATPWTTAHQASLSITNSQSSPKLTSIESVMPSSYLILCCPLLLPPISSSISLFQWVISSHQVAKVLEFQLQHQSFC